MNMCVFSAALWVSIEGKADTFEEATPKEIISL